jgi:histone H2A
MYRASPRTASPGSKRKIKKKVSQNKVSQKKVSKKSKRASNSNRSGKMPSESLAFHTYIYKVLKNIHPNCSMTQNAMSSVNSLERDLFEKMMMEAANLSKSTNSHTITSREILNATLLVFPRELAKHAVSMGKNAVVQFQSHSPGKQRTTQSSRASVTFPVGRIHTFMKASHPTVRIGPRASVFMAAVLEYVAAEVLELAGNVTRDLRLKRITPRAIMLAIKSDWELDRLLHKVTIRKSGVRPNMMAALLSTK